LLRRGAGAPNLLSVFFLFPLFNFDFKAIHERFLSYPNECPGEPGKKDVM
jgi:hypothetical protein